MSRKLKEPFARVALAAPWHPKLLKVPPSARWLWLAATCYCRQKETDGFLPRGAIPGLGVDRPWPLVAQLLATRLFEDATDGYKVHDYEHWQETKAEVQERRVEGARRQANYRSRHASNG